MGQGRPSEAPERGRSKWPDSPFVISVAIMVFAASGLSQCTGQSRGAVSAADQLRLIAAEPAANDRHHDEYRPQSKRPAAAGSRIRRHYDARPSGRTTAQWPTRRFQLATRRTVCHTMQHERPMRHFGGTGAPFIGQAGRSNAAKLIRTRPCARTKCESRESNPDGLPHWILSPARLPIPPLSLVLMQKQFECDWPGRQERRWKAACARRTRNGACNWIAPASETARRRSEIRRAMAMPSSRS